MFGISHIQRESFNILRNSPIDILFFMGELIQEVIRFSTYISLSTKT